MAVFSAAAHCTCLGVAASSAAPRRLASLAAAPRHLQLPRRCAVRAQQEKTPADLPVVSSPAEVPQEKDFWEGEQFEVLGTLASYAIPILAALAVGIGLFASQTYNEGATVFLDTPKSQDDTVRFIPTQIEG